MAWTLDLDYTYSGNVSASASLGDGLTCADASYFVQSGVLKRVSGNGGSRAPRTLLGSANYYRHKVEVTTAPISLQAAAGSSDNLQIGGVDHYTSSGLFIGGQLRGFNNGTAGANIESIYQNSGATAGVASTSVPDPTGQSLVVTYETGHPNGVVLATTDGTRIANGTTSANIATSGPAGVLICGNNAAIANNGITRIRIWHWEPNDAPLVTQDPTISSVSGRNIGVTVPTPTGGSGSYTYQWKVTNTTAVAATAISGASSRTYSYNAPADGDYWFNVQISDGVITIDKHVGGFTDTYAAAYTPEATVPTFNGLNAITTDLEVIDVGDSLVGTGNKYLYLQTYLRAASIGGKAINVTSCGLSGSRWEDWLPSAAVSGSGQSSYDPTRNNFNGALKACTDKGATWINLMLGTNGMSNSGEIGQVLSAFTASGKKVVLHDIPWKFNNLSNYAIYPAYTTLLDSFVNNTTIFRGQRSAQHYLQNYWPINYGGDGTHYVDLPTGSQAMAAFQAKAVLDALQDSDNSSSSSSTSSASSDSSSHSSPSSPSSASTLSSASSSSSSSHGHSESSSSSTASSHSSASSSSSSEAEGPLPLNPNVAQNTYPSVLINDDDPGRVSQIDQMVHQIVVERPLRGPVTVDFGSPYANSEIRYTTNGKNPTNTSHLYTAPLVFHQNATGGHTTVKARIYDRRNSNLKGKIIRAAFRIIPSR